jgi:hypothetical protein
LAIIDYPTLQTAVANWVERADLTLRIPEFIQLAEARINRRLARANLETDVALVGVPGSRFIPLSTGFDTAMVCWLDDPAGRTRLVPISPTQMDTSTAPGRPQYWAIDGNSLAFERPLDAAYLFEVRQTAMLALSVALPINSILTQWPDLYLNGTLAEAAPFMLDDDRLKIFEPKFQAGLDEVGRHESRNRAQAKLRVETAALGRQTRGFRIVTG